MNDLRIALLGQPHVHVDDEPLEVDTRKAVALLALVAVDGSWSRDALAALLWPDSDTARARAALRRTLSVLQRGLGHRWLQVARTTVGLDAPFTCDVTRTAGLLDEVRAHDHADGPCDPCRERLTEAVALHRGEFMEGFVLRDGPGFDDWRADRAEHLRRRLCGALDLLGRLHLVADDLDRSAEVCRRWQQVDPLNEQVHRRLMLLHAWRGERAEAIECYRSCVTALDRELGVMPMGKTTDLYRAILEDRLSPAPSPVRASAFRAPAAAPHRPDPAPQHGTAPGELPLVGRQEPLARLRSAHERAGGQLLVVSGEAGIGKTRLIDEFAANLRSEGRRVAATRCHPGEIELAFGPVVELLEQAVGQVPLSRLDAIDPWRLAEAARLVPELLGAGRQLPAVAPLSSPGAQARLFEAIWDVLEVALAIDGRGVVALDDLHAIDHASLDLLGYGLRRLADRELTVVVGFRPEEVVDGHVVRRLLDQSAIRDATCEVVLGRLTDGEVDHLVDLELDHHDAVTVGEQIRSESEGLPLLVIEYLRLARDTDRDDTAATLGDLRHLVPHGATELARRRLAQVSETARQIASTAATIGRSFGLSVVFRASGRTEDEVVAGLDELTSRQIVRELPDEQQPERGDVHYDFVHDKLRQAIYERTSLARRRLLHRRVAAALAAGTRGGRDAGAFAALIGDHHRRGGQEHEAAVWFRRAGDHARSLFANRDALGHYERALGLDDAGTGELHARVGEVRTLLGDYAGALSSLELAAARADDDAQLAGIEHQLGALHLRLGDIDAAAAHLDRGAALAGGSTQLMARIHADRALLAVRANDLDLAGAAAAQARSHGQAAEDGEAAAQAHNVQGLIARHRGDHATAREHFVRSAALAADLTDPDAHIAAMNNLALTEADSGDLDAALARATEAVTLVARRGDRHREAALRNNLADLLHRAGREEEAMAALKAAVTIFAEIGQEPDRLRPEIWKLVEW